MNQSGTITIRGNRGGLIARLASGVAWAAPLGFVFLALLKIKYPGVHFDEMLHVNAALGGLDDTFMYRSLDVPLLGRVPVILMPYIGALKAYITAPIFWVFGVSVLALRIPMIILVAFGLRLLFCALRRPLGPVAAAAVVVVLSVEPTLISLVRADSGPVAIQFFLTICAIWALDRYVQKRSYSALAILLGSLGLGVFNKLNFVWIVNAFVAAAVMVYGRRVWRSFKSASRNKRWMQVGTLIAGLGSTIGYYLLLSQKFNLGGFLDPAKLNLLLRLENAWVSLRGMLTGELYFDYALGDLQARGAAGVLALVGLLVVTGLVLYVVSPKIRVAAGRAYPFFWLLFGLTLAQVMITRNAVWPWHYATLYPALTIVLVLSIKIVARLSRFAWLSIAVLVMFYLLTYGAYLHQYNQLARGATTKNVYWSPAIYQLIDLTSDPDHRYVSLDWGTHTQLLGFSQDPNKFKNASFFLNRDPLPSDARAQFVQDYLSQAQVVATPATTSDRPFRFVLHAPEHTLFAAARDNFFALASQQNLHPERIKTISSGTEPLFEVYELR